MVNTYGNYDGEDTGYHFIEALNNARVEMKRAESYLLQYAEKCSNRETAERYRKVHKQMVRLRREWNSLERQRESAT